MREYTAFERLVKEAVLSIQKELEKVESTHRLSLEISAEGRVDGDIKISYRLGLDYESGTVGDSLGPVLTEAMRRKGWNDTHAPKAISHVTGEVVAD